MCRVSSFVQQEGEGEVLSTSSSLASVKEWIKTHARIIATFIFAVCVLLGFCVEDVIIERARISIERVYKALVQQKENS